MPMKVKINGNMAVVESGLDFKKLQAACRGKKIVTVTNDKGAVLFAAEVGKRGKATKDSVVFTYANADGKACFNFGPEEAGSADGKLTKDQICDALGDGLAAFNKYETEVSAAIDAANNAHEQIMAAIEVG